MDELIVLEERRHRINKLIMEHLEMIETLREQRKYIEELIIDAPEYTRQTYKKVADEVNGK